MADSEQTDSGLSLQKAGKPSDRQKVIDRFLEVQTKELDIRAREVEIEACRDSNNHEYNMKALEVEAEDRSDHRQGFIKIQQHRFYFIGALALISAASIVGLAVSGNAALALEVIKAGAFMGAGSFGGYFYGKSKNSPGDDS